MNCPACHADAPSDAQFCPKCGASLVASAPLTAVEMFKDVAIVHYRVTAIYEFKEGGTGKQVARITHTWRRTNGSWLIIGGMSVIEQAAKKEP